MTKRTYLCGRNAKGSLPELPVALFVLLFLIFFPLIDLFGLAIGSAITCLIAHQTAILAATQQRYDWALGAMEREALLQSKTGMARFCRLQPVGGYNGCGVDLYIDTTNYLKNDTKEYGPNMPVPPPIDTSSWLYQCRVRVHYDVGPTISLAGVPWLGNVPGLGRPARLTFTASRAAEHPQDLQDYSNLNRINGTMPATLDTKPITYPGIGRSGWNFPNIYDIIAGAGQTIVSEDVFIVQSSNSDWTATNIDLLAGDKLWIDYRADGSWLLNTSWSVDADGTPLNPSGERPMANTGPVEYYQGFRLGGMIGKIDSSDVFFLGKQKWNFPPHRTGQLYMKCNDYFFTDNTGSMVVRVIVAR